MIPKQKHRQHAGHTLTRVWLALLLAVMPVLASAGVTPASAPDLRNPAQADQQMPCHEDAGQSADYAQAADCPHCAGDGPASDCLCCDYAAPAGLASPGNGPATPPQTDMLSRLPVSEPLPHSAGDPLYRPPITRA